MLNLVIGIVLGAAFSKFWLSFWTYTVTKAKALMNKEVP